MSDKGADGDPRGYSPENLCLSVCATRLIKPWVDTSLRVQVGETANGSFFNIYSPDCNVD